jgi:hypothetical protein
MTIEISTHAMERAVERFWPRAPERAIRRTIGGEVNYAAQKGQITNRKPPTIDGERLSKALYARGRGGRIYVLRAAARGFVVVTVLRAAG